MSLPAETITLVRQQPALDIDRVALGHAHEPAERPMTADNTMTGNDERDRIGAARPANRSRRAAELHEGVHDEPLYEMRGANEPGASERGEPRGPAPRG